MKRLWWLGLGAATALLTVTLMAQTIQYSCTTCIFGSIRVADGAASSPCQGRWVRCGETRTHSPLNGSKRRCGWRLESKFTWLMSGEPDAGGSGKDDKFHL